MKRSALKRRTPLRRVPFERRVMANLRRHPPKAHHAGAGDLVWRRDLGPCIICPAEGGTCSGPVQGHHALSRQALKRRSLHRYLDDTRNRVSVCEHRHAQHTTMVRPIPRELLPASVFEFAAELGLSWWIDRHYGPPKGAA